MPTEEVEDIPSCIRQELTKPDIERKIKKGMRIAIGVGSRGIGDLTKIVKTLVEFLKEKGAEPFIIPAMGSHGGATPEGQRQILASYGFDEESMGVPVISSIDVVKLGRLPEGPEIYFDKIAFAADGIIPVNRIKLHTAFQGEVQSGILKMLVIGFGNHMGASTIHRFGADQFHWVIPEAGKFILKNTPVLFGIGVVENHQGKAAVIEAIAADDVYDREKELLRKARFLLPKIPFSAMDVLVIKEIGKNISGPGMDPNVTSRFAPRYLSYEKRTPHIQRMVLLDLTDKSFGNAGAVGVADIVTSRLVNKINRQATYINAVTAAVPEAAKIPLTVDSDYQAIVVALKTCYRVNPADAKLVWIKNTLELETMWVSRAFTDEVRQNPNLMVNGVQMEMPFDDDGSLILQ